MMDTINRLLPRPDTLLTDFIAPLPLDVCLDRLQSRDGTFFEIKTTIEIKEISADEYTFWMSTTRSSDQAQALKFDGVLKRQDETTTQVIITRDNYKNFDVVSWLIGLILFVCLVVGLYIKSVLVAMLVGGSVALFVYTLAYQLERAFNQQIVTTVEQIFGAYTPSDKAKNEPT